METIKKNQSDMKNALNEMKNNLQGINSEINEAKNQISNLEYKEVKSTNQNSKKKKESPPQNEESVRSLWDNLKCTNIHIMGVPEREDSKKLEIYLKKIVKENSLLVKEIDMQVQEAQSPNYDKCKEAHSKTHHY